MTARNFFSLLGFPLLRYSLLVTSLLCLVTPLWSFSHLTCVKSNWRISNLRSESVPYKDHCRLSCLSHSKANLVITNTERPVCRLAAETMLRYLSADIICSEMRTVFLALGSKKTVTFLNQAFETVSF